MLDKYKTKYYSFRVIIDDKNLNLTFWMSFHLSAFRICDKRDGLGKHKYSKPDINKSPFVLGTV